MLALISLLVTVAALFGWVSARVLRLPQTIGSMGLTVSASVALIAASSVLPGLHGWAVATVARIELGQLILHGVLGLLLFAGAFLLDLKALRRQWLAVGMLSILGTALTTVGVAAVMVWVLPLLQIRASWVECLLFGALIAPTDPIAVLEMLGRTGVSKEVEAQLAGESLFNDGVGAVLFLTLLRIAQGAMPTPSHVVLTLVVESGGALILGIALAWLASELMRRVERYQVEILMTLSLALGGYALGEWMHLSAPLVSVASGLALRQFNSRHAHREISHADLKQFWTLTDEVQNALLFTVLGLEVLAIVFTRKNFLAGGAAIFAVVVVRTLAVTLVLGLVKLMQRGLVTSVLALSWGGLRGGLSIALALSVPVEAGRGWILGATYLVVVFSVLLQGGSMGWVMGRTKARPESQLTV